MRGGSSTCGGGGEFGGGGDDSPHPAALYFLTAWTSTPCFPPLHGATLCGWLLPGPYKVAPFPPRETAICAAVFPFPYHFDASPWPFEVAFVSVDAQVVAPIEPPAVHDVLFCVLLDGFTPDDAELWEEDVDAAVCCAGADCTAGGLGAGAGAGDESFFT